MLRNAVGGRWVSAFLDKSITEVYGGPMIATRNGLNRPLSRRLDRCDRVIQDKVGDCNGGNV